MSDEQAKVDAIRQTLTDAHAKGTGATFGAFVKLSGPGWLQSAITLGGGSLAGALFLGVLGGTNLLWLQMVAIIMGVIMLSAISYVTLSTGKRPFQAINEHINPVLGWGWLIATCTANMIWCMPQFSLCFAALQKNLVGGSIGDDKSTKLLISAVILAATGTAIVLQNRQGLAAKLFDWFLKALVGMIVICFFGVVAFLGINGHLNWGEIFAGFIPDISQWSQPTGKVTELLAAVPADLRDYWTEQVVSKQRAVMIGAAATAVGINMTFLMPYAMINRGWNKPFRGLARFDLCTGMAIPYILVTSCVVIAAARSFHGVTDEKFLSTDPAVMQESPAFNNDAKKAMAARIKTDIGDEEYAALSEEQQLAKMAAIAPEEKRIISQIVPRSAFVLSQSLTPLLDEKVANTVFGVGIFGMGFSTIMILMLINGYAFCEMFGQPQGGAAHVIGCLVAGVAGAAWPFVWEGDAKLWLAILVSSFGMMLLPIAYFTFFMMMNSKSLMGDEKPTGASMITWNVLMGISVIGATIAAVTAIIDKAGHPRAGKAVVGVAVVYVVAVIIGFFLKSKPAEVKSA